MNSESLRLIPLIEVTRITSLKKTTLYELIKSGELNPIKLGRKTVFLESEIFAWVDNKLTLYRKGQQPVKDVQNEKK
jgi:prophage regulatory protein